MRSRDSYDVRKSYKTGTVIDDTDQPQGHIRLGAWYTPTILTPEELAKADKERRKMNKECEALSCKRRLIMEGITDDNKDSR